MYNKKSKNMKKPVKHITCLILSNKQYNIKFVRAGTVKKVFQLNRDHLVPKDLNLITNT